MRGLVAAVLEQSQALLTLFDAATTNTDLIPGSKRHIMYTHVHKQ